jgi:ABC-type branched-subunit amino acid transport system ATPase component
MFFSCIFYWALSWYLEKVFPGKINERNYYIKLFSLLLQILGEYGVPLDWNFLFKRDYWRVAPAKNSVYSYDNRASTLSRPSTPIARSNSIGLPVIHVDHLVKKFGPDKIAVNNVSFDLYENQITSLLGPNGSGKTTIFNCLIGIYKQTSGTITIANENRIDNNTKDNMEMLRKSIGYCPQHDILFDLLTIEEQLQFYASARGFGKYKDQISDEMLRLVNLEASKDVYCNTLSGGMKRRLSLACAFVGDTKIVLLDEVIILFICILF